MDVVHYKTQPELQSRYLPTVDEIFRRLTYLNLDMVETDFLTYDDFSLFHETAAQDYFWQEYICKTRYGEDYGGICGIVWSLAQISKIAGEWDVCSETDANLMFKITNHLVNYTMGQKKNYWKYLRV